MSDELLDRINARRERLRAEHGEFQDSDPMLIADLEALYWSIVHESQEALDSYPDDAMITRTTRAAWLKESARIVRRAIKVLEEKE